jgi:hypothetical protein
MSPKGYESGYDAGDIRHAEIITGNIWLFAQPAVQDPQKMSDAVATAFGQRRDLFVWHDAW